MPDLFPILTTALLAMSLLMVLGWVVHILIKNAGVVDLCWALGLVFVAAIYFFRLNGFAPRKTLIFFMVSVWGIRLALHLIQRLMKEKKEDARYLKIRENWKTRQNLKFFFFFQFQGLLDVILSVPFFLVCSNTSPPFYWTESLGFIIWFVAMIGESLSDFELRAFKSDPQNKGKVCQRGLWNYSRHPNYFFEWLTWVGYFFVALGSPFGWVAVLSPLIMLFLLLKISGIPPAEAQSLESRGEAYRAYQRTTSIFVPWFKQDSP